MNRNVGIQHQGLIVWDGANVYARDIRRHTDFGFVFEVRAALAADTVFKVQAHDPSAADNCVPDVARDVAEVPICQPVATPAPNAQIVIPAATPVGSICAATVPCYPGAFVSIAPVSGTTANVLATMILAGPMF